ncbi:MAG: hypothetical protein ACOCW8_02925, partial [bacterium]
IQKNLEEMQKSSRQWFGDNIPEDFSRYFKAINSAIYKYLEQSHNIEDFITDIALESIEPIALIRDVVNEYSIMWGIDNVQISEEESDTIVKSSENIFRDSITQLFLVLSQFWEEDTTCKITSASDRSNVHLKIRVNNIAEEAMDTKKLSRIAYSYYVGDDFVIRLGLLTPLENLRNTGAMVKVSSDKNRKELIIIISYPSIEFLNTINSVRNTADRQLKSSSEKRSGNLFIDIDDSIIAMVMVEELRESGYDIRDVSPDEKISEEEVREAKAYIIEYSRVLSKYGTLGRFRANVPSNLRSVLIYGSDDILTIDCDCKHIYFLKKPFDVDDVRVLVEGFLPSPV